MVQIQRLGNDIPVIYEYIPGLRSSAFGIFIRAGSAYETKENNGISHVIEHMLFKGTLNHNAGELADIMTELGSNINAYTAKEVTSVYGRVLNEDFETAVQIVSEIIYNSAFDIKELKKEKRVILDEIDLYDDSPEDLCHELLQKEIWKDSPLGYIISGTKTNVRNMTRDMIYETWQDFYIPDNIVISVAGGIDGKLAVDILNRFYGGVPKKGIIKKLDKPSYNPCFLTKYKDTEQIHLNIAFNNVTASDRLRFPMSIINAALGGNLNARLFQKVREELGLTYSIYSYSSNLSMAGLFHIYAAMNPAQTAKVVKAIYQVIDDFVQNGMQDEEVQCLKREIRKELILSGESASEKMNSNAKSFMTLGRVETLDDTIGGIEAVTTDEINECISGYFNLADCSMSLVGNTKEADIPEIKRIRSNTKRKIN